MARAIWKGAISFGLVHIPVALVLILLRWPEDVRGLEILELGNAVSQPELNKSELDMARRLIEDMAGAWAPDKYQDSFQEKIMALVDKKVHAGKIENVELVAADSERKSADVIDLTELLKKSLGIHKATPARERAKKSANTNSTAKLPATKGAGKTATKKTSPGRPKKSVAR